MEGHLLDLRSTRNRLNHADRALRLCLLPDSEDGTLVRWLEMRRSGVRGVRNLALSVAPVELGPILAEHLFGNTKTAVLTSATLATKRDFGYLKRRLGLGGGAQSGETLEDARPAGLRVAESVVDSHFDHATQSCLVIPTDLPGARNPEGADAYHRATAKVVYEVAEITGGGLFALFTSFAALRSVAAELRGRGAEGRWPLYVQGEADRSSLLSDFTQSGAAILLGTASFWEGVDVPGWPLRSLVIQKLPFRVPTEPMTEARVEAMIERGENPFWGFMLPDAAMRLKQGVGRLIRSRTDRGAVLILDDRLLTKRYGRIIRDALPPMPLVRGPWGEVKRKVTEFYRVE